MIWTYSDTYLKTWFCACYTDDMGLEADAVYQLADGRYALIEIKIDTNKIPKAEKTLLKFRTLKWAG